MKLLAAIPPDQSKLTSADLEAPTPPPAKRAKVVSLVLFRWSVLLGDEPVEISASPVCFLQEDNCRKDGEAALLRVKSQASKEMESSYKLTISKDEVVAPSPERLVEKVYFFIMRGEYQNRLHVICPGCRDGAQSQDQHRLGCLSELNEKQARVAHTRITVARLSEASEGMRKEYGLPEDYLTKGVVSLVLASARPEKGKFLAEKFEYEYKSLVNM